MRSNAPRECQICNISYNKQIINPDQIGFQSITTMTDQEQNNPGNSPIKLIAVGDSGVGKSSVLTRFVSDKFNQFNEPTLGAAFLTKKYTLPQSNQAVEFHIWDTAGQEKYKSIAPIYYREAKIALCVYDICSSHSFEVLQKWVKELQENGPKDIVLAVVGNKIDRYDDEEVNYAEAKAYAESIDAIFKLVSAKEGKNINDLFTTVAERVLNKGASGPRTAKSTIRNAKGKKKSCC